MGWGGAGGGAGALPYSGNIVVLVFYLCRGSVAHTPMSVCVFDYLSVFISYIFLFISRFIYVVRAFAHGAMGRRIDTS